MLGCTTGMAIVFLVDTKWLNFSVEAKPWEQFGKIVFGLLVVLAVILAVEGIQTMTKKKAAAK